MTKPFSRVYFKVPLLFYLVFMLSKYIFSYESEEVVIFCILSFVIIAYYSSREMFYESLASKSNKLEEEYTQLFTKIQDLTKKIRSYFRIFLDLEDKIVEIYYLTKVYYNKFLNIKNKNRSLFLFYLVKDELNFYLQDDFLRSYKENLNAVESATAYLKLLNSGKINTNINLNNNESFNSKLNSVLSSNSLIYLIMNKLNLNNKDYLNFLFTYYIK